MKQHGLRSLRNSGALKVRDLYRANVFDLVVIEGRSGRDETTERYQESIEELYQYVKNGGKVPPIKVTINPETGAVEVMQGHRRRRMWLRLIPELQAEAKALGLKQEKIDDLAFIECMPFEGNDADQVVEILAGNESLGLTDVEAGVQLKRLRDVFDLSVEQICKKLGKKRSWVDARLTIAGADTDLQKAVDSGEIKATAAAAAVKKHGKKAGEVVQKAKSEAVAKGGKARVTGAAVAPKSKPNWSELLAAAEELFEMYKEVETFKRLGAAIEQVKK